MLLRDAINIPENVSALLDSSRPVRGQSGEDTQVT